MLLPFVYIHMYHQCYYGASGVATDVTLYHFMSANEAGGVSSAVLICALLPGLGGSESVCHPLSLVCSSPLLLVSKLLHFYLF